MKLEWWCGRLLWVRSRWQRYRKAMEQALPIPDPWIRYFEFEEQPH